MDDQLPFTDISDCVISPPAWVVKNILPVGLTFIGGPPKKSFKSTLSMALAASVTGHPHTLLPDWLQKADMKGPVMAFTYEAQGGELKHTLTKGMGVALKPDSGILIADDPFEWRLDDPDSVGRLMAWLEHRKPALLILDPLRDFHSQDENDSGEMIRVTRPLRQWAVETDAAVVFVHHTTKAGQEDGNFTAQNLRGTGALFGKADGLIMVTPGRVEGNVKYACTFKRAPGWEAEFVLGIFGRTKQGYEVIQHSKQVIALMGAGGSWEEIAGQIKGLGKRHMEAMLRNGLIEHPRGSKRLRVTKRGFMMQLG